MSNNEDNCDDFDDGNYYTKLKKSYDGHDGVLGSSNHKTFVKMLLNKLDDAKSIPLKRIKELDNELEIDAIPIYPEDEDEFLECQNENDRSPTVKISESVYDSLKDCYKSTACLKTIIKKLIPFIRVPYLIK